MKFLAYIFFGTTSLLLMACAGSQTVNQPSPVSTPVVISAHRNGDATSAPTPSAPSVVTPAHGGDGNSAASVSPGVSDKAPVATPELDAGIEKTSVKAKASSASAADKKAAATAYMARGNFYYNAGDPRLYRYALGDFRRALRYQPDNEEAKDKVKQIEEIYASLHRPVPTNGLDP